MNTFKADIRPSEYLAGGLVDDEGKLLEGINGEHSLAMAYRLRDDGYKPAEFETFRKRLAASVEAFLPAAGEGGSPFDKKARAALLEAAAGFRDECSIMNELILAAEGHIVDWRSFARFMEHLERINAQLALVCLVE